MGILSAPCWCSKFEAYASSTAVRIQTAGWGEYRNGKNLPQDEAFAKDAECWRPIPIYCGLKLCNATQFDMNRGFGDSTLNG